MKSNHLLIAYLSIGFLISMSIISCSSGLDDRQKLFLKYAKLEDVYRGTGFYHNFDLYDLNIETPVYLDSTFNSANFKAKFIKNFKLIDNGRELSPDFGDLKLQYPHQFVLIKNENGSVNTKFSVFVPDNYYKFSVDKEDIGKTILKDSVAITLLDMTNDGVTLMIENKGTRQSYDYTYDSFERKDFSERQKYKEPKEPGYEDYLFVSEQVDPPNTERTSKTDSLLRSSFSRLSISVADQKGKTLASEGSINSFRHYLWYRNNDMPYPELTTDYYAIKQEYKELDNDSLHKFHPIDIVTIKASGKIDKVEFFLRSNKGRIENIDLGDVVPQKPIERASVIEQNEVLPISNITKEELNKVLKINCNLVPGKSYKAANILIYASLPYGYNNERTNWNFSDMKIIGESKDTLDVNDYENGYNYFRVGYGNQSSNLSAVKITPKMQRATKIIGKIRLEIPNYYDKIYNLNNIPEWIKIDADGKNVSFYNSDPSRLGMVEFLVFGKQVGKKPMDIIAQKYEEATGLLTNTYAEKVNKITVRFKNEEKSLSEEIPFELEIPKVKKEE